MEEWAGFLFSKRMMVRKWRKKGGGSIGYIYGINYVVQDAT
jgi:hypothetical protein